MRPNDKEYRYNLTVVNCATKYPEAVPLNRINIEMVVEALFDMYSRVGVLKEVLSDLGTQFTSYCMKEVSQLLSIRQQTTFHITRLGQAGSKFQRYFEPNVAEPRQ